MTDQYDLTAAKLHETTDARVWAEDFCNRFVVHKNDSDEVSGNDVGLMIGWFANAIETGRMAETRPKTDAYGRCGDLVRVGSAAFEDEAQKRDASIARIVDEQRQGTAQ